MYVTLNLYARSIIIYSYLFAHQLFSFILIIYSHSLSSITLIHYYTSLSFTPIHLHYSLPFTFMIHFLSPCSFTHSPSSLAFIYPLHSLSFTLVIHSLSPSFTLIHLIIYSHSLLSFTLILLHRSFSFTIIIHSLSLSLIYPFHSPSSLISIYLRHSLSFTLIIHSHSPSSSTPSTLIIHCLSLLSFTLIHLHHTLSIHPDLSSLTFIHPHRFLLLASTSYNFEIFFSVRLVNMFLSMLITTQEILSWFKRDLRLPECWLESKNCKWHAF